MMNFFSVIGMIASAIVCIAGLVIALVIILDEIRNLRRKYWLEEVKYYISCIEYEFPEDKEIRSICNWLDAHITKMTTGKWLSGISEEIPPRQTGID